MISKGWQRTVSLRPRWKLLIIALVALLVFSFPNDASGICRFSLEKQSDAILNSELLKKALCLIYKEYFQ
jgi:hypothetical protein